MPQQFVGIYRQGHIEFMQAPLPIPEETPVIVTLSNSSEITLTTQGITPEQAQQLRNSLVNFSEEWNSSEMSIYDDYDTAQLNP